ncbi:MULTISPECIES: DUF3078 domain-containing protein [Flavobacteriaceae]|jgi:hypothetical protein|uniref:DUF3078 domain-containing protein n=2 Tax=Flavobacteriaceae TaxID=49546 RepID=A0ABN1JL26_9FLAO|nr:MULTISPECIES: DUF3078 domain-containing protein [Flavobacteriaceae]RYH72298.1 DUF3078 domain-containing protein [Flavobacteriaceae bacterium 144Ye]TBV26209.1 hypothetical protein DMZ43_09935 [Meridianimaribacter sp. CL38]TDY07634.1 Protein of unknown function (DUF3078) [Meridianimaribacter flavus]
MKNLFYLIFLLVFQFSYSQPDSLFFKKKIKEIAPKWELVNRAGLDLSEVAFVNWSAGGSNSISALVGVTSNLTYRHKNFVWKSIGSVRYGINKQESQKVRKTEDVIELASNLGYRKDTLNNWFYSARFNFKTQITNGYNYPDRNNPISQFMAPGYLFFGVGAEYGKNMEKLNLYLSPLTFKSTFVLDEDLANAGSFGVTPAEFDDEGNVLIPGQRVRTEMGVLITNAYETTLLENISIVNLVSFYTDYLNSFGNVDVDWEVVFDFKVNNYVRATLGSHLKYDNDVKIIEPTEVEDEFVEKGARVQWKQLLGVGVVVDF